MKEDRQWIEGVLNGDSTQFSHLVKKYQKDVLRIVFRMTRNLELSEDITQDSFVKAFRKIETYKGQAPFRSWLFQIALNTAKNKLREKSRQMLNIEQVNLAVSTKAEFELSEFDLKECLKREIDTLPSRQKMALVLRIFEDLSFKEISQIMECPYDTAKANYRHALMKLKDRLSGNFELMRWGFGEQNSEPEFMGYISDLKQ